jgi:hypothetical protein
MTPNKVSTNRPPFKVGWFILALILLSSCGGIRYIPENPVLRYQDSLRDAEAHEIDIRNFMNH